MIYRYMPTVIGLLASITVINIMTIFFRLIGMNRGDAFYLACVIFSIALQFVVRWITHKPEKE